MDDEDTNISELEAEFKKLYETHAAEIKEKVAAATKLLDEACALADKYGVPFSSSVSHIAQTYTPASCLNKFNELDDEFIDEATNGDVYGLGGEYGSEGWQNSAICY